MRAAARLLFLRKNRLYRQTKGTLHKGESPTFYLLSFGSVMTSLNEEARPARLWISLGMMILVALPSAALPNASSDLRRMT